MGKVRKIKDRDNQMVAQIRELLINAFPPMFKYNVLYFIGEEEGTERIVLVFDITSEAISGSMYCKTVRVDSEYAIDDIEPDFIGKILTDFILLGTTLLTNNIMASKASQKEDSDAILAYPFSKSRLNSVNLN